MQNIIKIIRLGESEYLSNLLEIERAKNFEQTFALLDAEKISSEDLSCSRLLFAIHLEKFGTNPKVDAFVTKLAHLCEKNPSLFEQSVGAVFISSEEEEYTKMVASLFVYRLNKLGLRFIGRPILEAPRGLANLTSYLSRNGLSEEENLKLQFEKLILRLANWENAREKTSRNILVLHSSNEDSNTLELWQMVRQHLGDFSMEEIFLGNGKIFDCKDCGYKICKHFAKQKSCYYGGIVVEEVYPAILSADILVMLCPNYNDAITANLSAMINRLTALFRHQKFYDKKIYAVIVSGSSGTEAVATQLVRALNMNKTFELPPEFSLSAIANDKGAIHAVPEIQEKAKRFAQGIIRENL